jgi:hypothetical protein
VFDRIEFQTTKPTAEELLAFYRRQKLRATYSREKLQRMIDMTACFATARADGELVGLARGVTDGLSGRLAECKLDPAYQGPACVTRQDGRIEHDSDGIAREMARLVIERLRSLGVERIDAVAYGTEVDFCEELGFRKMRGVVALELGTDKPLPASTLAASGTTTL